MKFSFACAVVVGVGCHGSSQPKEANKTDCSAKLTELASFYETVAADNARPGLSERIETAHVRIRELPSIGSGAPVDTSHATLLLLRGMDNDRVDGDDGSTVLVIDAETPWSHIVDALHDLRRDGARNVSVAYTVPGAIANRPRPQVKGLDLDHIDLPSIGVLIAKTSAEHCPAYAKQLAAMQSGTAGLNDPSFLRGLAATLPTCDCGVDTSVLELMPWLVARSSVTTVPLAASAPAHDPGQRWGELVAAAKGPVPLALPELPPPPPPPPRRRR